MHVDEGTIIRDIIHCFIEIRRNITSYHKKVFVKQHQPNKFNSKVGSTITFNVRFINARVSSKIIY